MTLQSRDRRALAMLAVSGVLTLGWWLSTSDDKSTDVVAAADSVPMAEKRLVKLRQTAAAVPGREEALKKVQLELSSREAGMIRADTAQQAQAQLMQILTKIGHAQQPPIGIRASEIGQIKSLGEEYGEVAVSVSFDCRVEQLVNLLADISAQKELIATSELRIGNAHPKEKIMPVRLTVSGVVPRKLIPDKKGVTLF
ncbi:MAG: type II secretion system protein GspM [Bryobacteraceae bacterium]